MKAPFVVLGALVCVAVAAFPSVAPAQTVDGQAEGGASVLIGAGAGVEPNHLSGVLQGHVGAGWRAGRNMVAAVSSFSYSQASSFFGSWTVSRKYVGFGVLGAHWLTPSWHVDVHGLVGPAFDALSGVEGTTQTVFAWSAGLGAGWRWLALLARYQGGLASICRDNACYEAPGGFQLVLTATADVLRAGQ